MAKPSVISHGQKEKTNTLNELELKKIRSKLSDGRYIYGAIYCLASILADRMMDLGVDIDDDAKEESGKRKKS